MISSQSSTTSVIRRCENRSGDLEPGGYQITTRIEKDTLPITFDEWVKAEEGYELKNGGRCRWNALGAAAFKGNVALISHIVEKGERSF